MALALLEEVGLGARATHRPGELSGGEQQRVAMARALVLSPKLLLADEPTGNLDSKTGQQIQDLFFAMNAKHGTTVIVVTHDLNFAKSMPRVVTMKDGLVDADERTGRAGRAAAGARPAFEPEPEERSSEATVAPVSEPAPEAPVSVS